MLRLMEGEFMRYKDIIPKDNDIDIIVGKNHTFGKHRRLSLLARGRKEQSDKNGFEK